VRFDIERGVGGFARNAASDVFALAGCSVCLNKCILDMQKKYAKVCVVLWVRLLKRLLKL